MSDRKWSLNVLQNPACIHLCVTLCTLKSKDLFIQDIKDSISEIKEEGEQSSTGGFSAIYGLSKSLPAGPINEMLNEYADVMLSP